MSLVTVAGLPPSSRSRTTVDPRTSPDEETAAAATYRRVLFASVLGRGMMVSKPWRGDWVRRFVWLLMVLWSLEANFWRLAFLYTKDYLEVKGKAYDCP